MAGAERVLFVHAHPDDETIDTGGTIATLVERGAQVTVLTCTRGERGEVLAEDLKAALESPAAMAELREKELREAMRILGVRDHRFLGDDNARWAGQAGRAYTDSGMRWGRRGAEAAETSDPESLTAAPLADVTSDIASVLIAVSPDAVISYDDNGGYGHPDHVRVSEAARRAADIYGVPFFSIVPERADAPARAALAPTVSVDIAPVLDRKREALGAYRSQLRVDGGRIRLSGGQLLPLGSVERFARRNPEEDEELGFSDQHPAARFAVSVLAGIIGVAFGALLSVYNQATQVIGGQPIWVGAIGAILIAAALFAGFRLVFSSRVVPGFAAVGMIVVVGILSLLGAGGSVLIPWNGPGILWQVAPTVLAVVAIAWPSGRRARPGRINVTPLKGLQP